MHDIDRAMFEYEQGSPSGELAEAFETQESYETYESLESSQEAEAQEMELAAQLLEVSNEAELDQFLGGLLSTAARAARSFVRSPTGRALGGVLKSAARQVLPQVGGIVGSAIGGSSGAQLGQRAGRWLGSQFELEGMSSEDRELELARAFVRMAGDATRIAQRNLHLPPTQAATAAVVRAARQSLPGLVPVITGGGLTTGQRQSGRWVRRGNRIVLLGV